MCHHLGFFVFSLVEVMGLEPTASSMRPKRSSQLSYTPEGDDRVARPSPRFGNSGQVRTTHASSTTRSLLVATDGIAMAAISTTAPARTASHP